MEKIEMLYDHYKETYSMILEKEKSRDKLFLMLCFLVLFLMLFYIFPSETYSTISNVLNERLGIDLLFGHSVINSFLWILLVYITVRYYQININIDRQYSYIHNLEEDISKRAKVNLYRESKNYNNDYPSLLDFVYYFYKFIFPILYTLILVLRICLDRQIMKNNLAFSLNFILFLSILALNVVYIYFNIKLQLKSVLKKKK